jgi:hypothetical protein
MSAQELQRVSSFLGKVVADKLPDLTDDESKALASVRGELILGISSLSPAAAAHLSAHCGVLRLANIDSVPVDVARQLGKHSGALELPRCRELSSEALRWLMLGNKQSLTVGIGTIDKAVAEAIAAYPGQFVLLDSERILDDAAEPLRKFQGHLWVTLTELTPGAAQALAGIRGRVSLTVGRSGCEPPLITSSIAKSLIRVNGPLTLRDFRLASSDADEAAVLARHPHDLSIRQRQPTILEPVLAQLGQRKGRLRLSLPGGVTPSVVQRLCEMEGDLELEWPPEHALAVATALATHRSGALTLTRVDPLSEPIASALAVHSGPLSINLFDGNPTADTQAIAAMCRHKGPLGLPAAYVRADTIDSVLSHEGGLRITFGFVNNKKPDFVQRDLFRKVANYPGPLFLDGSITTDLASGLESRKGDLVVFEILDDESIPKSLLTSDGRLFVWNFTVASTVAAELFASAKNRVPVCSSQALIGPAASQIASIIVQRKGTISFPRLRYVSEDALRTLATRDDIQLPPLESLYVIDSNGCEVDPADIVSAQFLERNATYQPPLDIPKRVPWDQVIKVGVETVRGE